MLYALTFLLAQGDKPAPTQEPPGGQGFLLVMVLIMAAFFLIVILPARRREKREREQLDKSLKKNDEVLTSSGIIGTVANLKDNEVTLKVDESSNVRMRFLRSSIVKILTSKESNETTGETGK
jgi:preprotein translocase subunit YajC